jgi:chorismate mutase
MTRMAAQAWFQNDLDAVIFLVHEHAVAVRRIAKLHLMRNDEARIDLAILNSLEQRFHVAMNVALAGVSRPFRLFRFSRD